MTAKLKPRIENIITKLADGLYEREETISVSLLAALSGQSTFLYGLPGTAKSLIARRIAQAFKGAQHFEYLMQRFSTPEEVFGPVSILELKNDKYVRKTEGYLPCADLAFLDEIWKSSPAILNTLLTIINERIFRNGSTETKVPLKALIAASNETPPPNQGLEALYDRFVVRLLVSPMQERANFERLLQDIPIDSKVSLPDDLLFTHDQWAGHLEAISLVTIPAEVLEVIHAIKCQLAEFNSQNPDKTVYVSDRRWQKISLLLKAAAYFCDRDGVLVVDLLLLRHCLWTLEANREQIAELVENCVKRFGHPNRAGLEKWEVDHKDLECQINETFFHTEDVLYKERIGDEDCVPFSMTIKRNRYGEIAQYKFYAPLKNQTANNVFNPIKESGVTDKTLQCMFTGNVLHIKIDSDVQEYGVESGYKSGKYVDFDNAKLNLLFKKGSTKDVSSRVKKTYETATEDSKIAIKQLIASAKAHYLQQQQQNDTPFVPHKERELVLTSLKSHIDELENHQLNAEHLCEKVIMHANTQTSPVASGTRVAGRRLAANVGEGATAV